MIAALSFLTVVGRGREPSARAVGWFPAVGVVIGLAVASVWDVADDLWTLGIAAALAVAVDLALTGMLHLDGLADTADGVLPHLPRERRLEVMREPTIGAFALGVVPVVLLLRWTALTSMEPDYLLVAALWGTSRAVMAVAIRVLPYARGTGGLGAVFAGGRDHLASASAALLVLAVMSAWELRLAVATGIAVIAGTAVLVLARRRLGGYTGDVLGAAGIVAETAGLLTAAAWS